MFVLRHSEGMVAFASDFRSFFGEFPGTVNRVRPRYPTYCKAVFILILIMSLLEGYKIHNDARVYHPNYVECNSRKNEVSKQPLLILVDLVIVLLALFNDLV